MAKSKKTGGSSSAGSGGDGRRNNKTPDEFKIKPGEVRNPHGRGGKPSKEPLTSIDRWYLEEAARVVSRDANGDVCAAKRMVQEEFVEALVEKNDMVRNRTINRVSQSASKFEKELREFEDWYWNCRDELTQQFEMARQTGRPAPDAAHPDHVHLRNGRLVFTGPIDREARRIWEHRKAIIKIAAYLHSRARVQYRLYPSEENRNDLKYLETHRRRVMRTVPKGWNWREDIYCRHSWTKFVQETIAVWERGA